ncbi:Nicotinamide nucleotide repair protein [Anaerococcus prevotii]|uniref:ADP-dependent (S)-NAD(P)H-hydrate dehydratase n=1 Tax=Anaerococcus prevotii (strain ATCC 9321 / DSM 20548 / JCM 6508 / NCTC 11806 / PC1) TaxID=525919 RepID=C7RHP3_ANAPD|nr:NAD(P)H-hydrate dehydratase [Anaerococcus prevotii]ACV29004.1 carbohydrate kinase, YjeF related protein [Anaerococcus prevotii DSM 20548]SUU94677.1 Nicotinamide nucleotide repair protein [Anaerococcus prevotii]
MLGIDLVSINKFKEKSNILKIFTEKELDHASQSKNFVMSLSGIFAAKEATIKAYGFNLSYIINRRIEIRYRDRKPCVLLDGFFLTDNISISHDGDYALAVCESNLENVYVDEYFKKIFPKRKKDTHKGDYGKIAILGGSSGMSGSVYLSSMAALRTGAGLVYNIVPKSISNILQIKTNEQIILPLDSFNIINNEENLRKINYYLKDKDILAIGPGMGQDDSLNSLINSIFKDFSGKILIDADGLNAISSDIKILKNHKNLVLTPHIMEFSRLTKLSLDQINSDRIGLAKKFARDKGVILVLKSEETIVTDGFRIYINKIGNPGMATAGSGDVLSGVISALLHRLDNYEAACLGVYIQSLAGDLASKDLCEDSIIASDIVNHIPGAMKLLG